MIRSPMPARKTGLKATTIRASGKPTPDGPRYKALGNSMAIPPMRWIGQRIAMVEAIQRLELAA